MNSIIKLQKDPLKKLDNLNAVYKINCSDCDKCYVGQTKRLLSTRKEEHQNNIKYNQKYHNVISKHILQDS